jgi:pyruvate, water dikinase
MIGLLRGLWRKRRERRERAVLDALKVRYHTFRILLANNERALTRLAAVEAGLAGEVPAGELVGLVEDLQAVTFEMVDGVARLAPGAAAEFYTRHLRLEEALRESLETVEEAGRGPSCLPLAQALNPDEVGGKAAGVSLLMRNGFPVPDGFAVTVRACREFLAEAGLDEAIRRTLRKADSTDAGLATASQAIRRDILEASLPEWLHRDLSEAVAVLVGLGDGGAPPSLAARSSALTEDRPEHSFAGQFASVLNCSPDTLEQGFREVMAGAFTERAIAYRQEAGIPPATLDMAVLVQVMVPAVAAGVVFTVDPVRPESGRMLVSAVPGLGVLAVDGAVPVDVYRVDRDDPTDFFAQLARKTRRAVADAAGGIRREAVPEAARNRSVLATDTLVRLARLSLAAEALAGSCRDLEYAVDGQGRLWLLQSRPARIAWGGRRPPAPPKTLYQGGMTASSGRTLGRVHHLAAGNNGQSPPQTGPVIAVLATAAPEAASWISRWRGVVVENGNPADHLSTVAREAARPMLTRAGGAAAALPEGGLAVLDAGEGRLTEAPAAIGDLEELLRAVPPTAASGAHGTLSPARTKIRDLVVPLTLASGNGPGFSLAACRTLHDLIRFAHETAVLALFEAGDSLLDGAVSKACLLGEGTPFPVMVIDLGGGLTEEVSGGRITPGDLASIPLAALWRGLAASKAFLGETDPQTRQARHRPNYALAARDYVNLNARMTSHFAMVDAVCGPRPRGNYVRLRFKGGGTAAPQRERRALCLESILRQAGFFVNRRGDLVSAALTDIPAPIATEALELLGRLLGFARDLDAAMTDDDAPYRAAEAFLAGQTATGGPASVQGPDARTR